MKHIILPDFLRINRRWETCVLTGYADKSSVSIGWGTGRQMAAHYGIAVEVGTVITQQQADDLHINSINDHYAPELERHLDQENIETNDHEFNALLDVYYNRGACRLIGCDRAGCGHKQGSYNWFKGSLAWHWLTQKDDEWFMKRACRAIVQSHDADWTPLDMAFDKVLGHERIYLGLELRRIDDASMFQTK